jgi:hypothetical protein
MFEHILAQDASVMPRSSSKWVGLANIAPPVTPGGRHHRLDAEDVERPAALV